MSLWLYLSEILDPYQRCDDAIRPIVYASQRYIHLLLRYIECGFLIHALAKGRIRGNINVYSLLSKLDDVIASPSQATVTKSRALVMRITEQCTWGDSKVTDLDGEPASAELIAKSVEQSEEAVRLHEMSYIEAEQGAVAARYVRAMVYQSIGLQGSRQALDRIQEQVELCNRDDLYLSLMATTRRVGHVTRYGDVNAFRSCISEVREMLNLGEYGKLFHDGWWKKQYQYLVKVEPWKSICLEELTHGKFQPVGWREMGQSTVPSSPSSTRQHITPTTPILSTSPTGKGRRVSPNETAPPKTYTNSETGNTSPTPVMPKALPTGWEKRVSDEGAAYFVNRTMKTSYWANWHEESGNCELRFSESGKPYVVNHTTKTSKWFDPRTAASTMRKLEAGAS